MHQAVQVPLRAHLGFAPQREAAHALVVADVGEHRLHGGDALARVGSVALPALEAGKLAASLGARRSQALRAQPARRTVFAARLVAPESMAPLAIRVAVAGERLARRAGG